MNKTFFTFSKIFFTALIAGFFIVPLSLRAQTLSLQSAETSYKPSEPFLVEASIDTLGKSINAVSGSIQLPPHVSVSDIRSGNSVVTIWITNPHLDNPTTISFAGGTPGGYTGSHGTLFSFVVTPNQEGPLSLSYENIKVLLNDGNGTEAQAKITALSLSISKTAASATSFTPTKDTTPPEPFTPVVSKDSQVADNKYFLSFFAVDKDSGIARYDITESPILPWMKVSSTTDSNSYVLTNQFLPEKVTIKAYDRAGNVTETTVSKPPSSRFYIVLVILLVLILIVCFRWVRRKQ